MFCVYWCFSFPVSYFNKCSCKGSLSGLQAFDLLLQRVLEFQSFRFAEFPLVLCAQWIQASGHVTGRLHSPVSRQNANRFSLVFLKPSVSANLGFTKKIHILLNPSSQHSYLILAGFFIFPKSQPVPYYFLKSMQFLSHRNIISS